MKIQDLGSFLAQYASALLSHVDRAFPAVVREPGKLPELLRKPLGRQALAIHAARRALETYGTAIVVGEMGSGKSFIAAATAAAASERTLVLCPPHLVEKWRAEIEATVPKAQVVIAETITDLEQARKLPSDRPLFVVLSRERAKLGAPTVPQGIYFSRGIPRCIRCGQVFRDEKSGAIPGPASIAKLQRPVCARCGEPLYAPDPKRARRKDGSVKYPLAEYVKRRMRGFFDLLILDEAHEYKAADSAQGVAAGMLAEAIPRSLILTGTLFGGYASTLFFLLWRFVRPFREHFARDEVKKFIETYGAVERVEVVDKENRGITTRRGRTALRTKEIPATSPMLLYFLLPFTVFLKLSDVAGGLPPYGEEVREIDPGPLLEEWYDSLMGWFDDKDLRKEPHLLGAYFHAGVFSIDTATEGFNVADEYAHPPLELETLPKEEELVELVRQERARGRRVIVFVQNTGERNLAGRLERILTTSGFRARALYSSTASARKREAWIQKAVREGLDVLILHPRLVQTGLDLIDFPTLVYYQVEPSVYVLRQAARRSWRIGQKHPVRVVYFVYRATLQTKALGLLAAKAQASHAIEGLLVEGGLNAMANDEASVSLARALAGARDTSFDPSKIRIATLGLEGASANKLPENKELPPKRQCAGHIPSAPLELPTVGELEKEGVELPGRKRPPKEAAVLFPELLKAG
ncbi:helicase domain protein (plasmid) [Oceanithermus profundus DSM 14977]|uniref:Helicase domain protein n=1 Tax=Oceanithermus profundus (strain DSM 14977 / NBRC 100410 / VKM B-2274 / 506) TaxID=670487 RepID=E4UAR7_OCEP5|nr:helicase-related protein [Oceanithermus profundus]ADR37702.1 helicase domain protein [Oceanithermus profundus DSM 14977]